MVNFTRELAKAVKRFPKVYSHFSNTPFLTNILEDKIFLDTNLEDCIYQTGNFMFSLTFLADLRTDVDRSLYFVMDGTEHWFNKFNKSEEGQLKRCPSLYHTMYRINKDDYEHLALTDNPWLLTAFKYSRPRVNVELIASVNDAKVELENAFRQYLDEEFMPRGVWGIDYIFKAKSTPRTGLRFGVHNQHQLISLDEYLERVR